MLEIIGTFLGAIHSVFLQRKVKGFNRTVNNMIQCKVDLKITLKLYLNALENEKRRKEDEQRERANDKADIPHETLDLLGYNGAPAQNNDLSTEERRFEDVLRHETTEEVEGVLGQEPTEEVEDILGQEPTEEVEDVPGWQEPEDTSSQNPEDIPHQDRKYKTYYYSGMVSGQNIAIHGGTFHMDNGNILDQSIKESIEDQKERFERLQSTMQEIRRLDNSQLGVVGLIENILEKAGDQLNLNVRFVNDSARDSPSPGLARVPTQPFNVNALHPGSYNAGPMPPIFKFGNIPVLSMASGVVCLALSTILLSAATKDLGPEVWISSTLVLAMVVVLSLFPFRLVSSSLF